MSSSSIERRYLSFPIRELRSYQISSGVVEDQIVSHDFVAASLLSRAVGWVGGENRQVEVWSTPSGVLLKVEGGSDFYIFPGVQSILKLEDMHKSDDVSAGSDAVLPLTSLDQEILLGPALVLALAMDGAWCLHCSAAVCDTEVFVFLGESGQGKSTLATYLSTDENSRWHLLADDILPITLEPSGLISWPHFPQLKLPMDGQPGLSWPERISISKIFVLVSTEKDVKPGALLLANLDAVRTLVEHTAGTRLFDEKLLGDHLAFCAQAAEAIPVYQLNYPHSRDVLPEIKEMLESLC